MDEQDHANARAKLMRAIFIALPNYQPETAARLVGDLSEFVRGIVREEMRGPKDCEVALSPKLAEQVTRIMGELAELRKWALAVSYSPRCTCPWSTEAPLSLDCPVHGMARKTAPHHHHDSLGSGGFICSLDECAPNACTDPHAK
jgi:hypothetical protein